MLCYEGKHLCFQNWAAKLKAVALGQKGDGNRTYYSNHLSGPQFPPRTKQGFEYYHHRGITRIRWDGGFKGSVKTRKQKVLY